MKKIHLISILAIVALLIGATFMQSENSTIAIVVKVRGDATVIAEGQDKTTKIKRGFRLKNGDKVQTNKKTFAAIKFIDDASMLRMRENSTLIIRGKQEQNKIAKNVFVEVGQIFARVTKQKGTFQVATPTSVASVKGTDWWTDHDLREGTFYHGEGGLVEISNQAGTALLREGETAFVASKNAAPIVRKTKEGEKPTLEDIGEEDEFEFQFENESGQTKSVKFKVKNVE